MLGDALSRQIETFRELRNRVLIPVAEARNDLETRDIAKSRKYAGRTDGFSNVRRGRQCVWPECPSLLCSNAALPVALILETAENPIP